MGIETFSSIRAFSDLIQSVSANISKLRGTSKQRFGKKLISLFNILDEAQDSISQVLEALEKMKILKPGSKRRRDLLQSESKLIAKALAGSEGIENAYHRLSSWVKMNERFSLVLDLIHPTSKKTISSVLVMDDSVLVGREMRGILFSTSELYTRIQSLEARPTKSSLNSIKRDLRGIDKEIELLKVKLRELAKHELTIDDLF